MLKVKLILLLTISFMVSYGQTHNCDTTQAIVLNYNYASFYNTKTNSWEGKLIEEKNTFMFYPIERTILQYYDCILIDKFIMLEESSYVGITLSGHEYKSTQVINNLGNRGVIMLLNNESILLEVVSDTIIEYRLTP